MAVINIFALPPLQILGLRSLLGTESLWPFLLAFTAVPSILQMASIPFMPKSPRFLLIDQQKEDEARNGELIVWQLSKAEKA